MKMKRYLIAAGLVLALGVAGVVFAALPRAAAASVEPVWVEDNPSCTDLGYDFGYKVDPPSAGTYTFPDGVNTVTVTTDGIYFGWTSTLGIDAVIVKGGPDANLYVYDPPTESFGDAGLHSPINPSNGQPYGLSHIEFCYDYEVEVTKDAHTTFTRTWHWTIDKSVTPAVWDMFTGDSGASQYTVAVTKTGYTDSDWAVNGTITIHNPAPVAATIASVTDVVSGGIPATVNCGVSFPYSLAAGGTLYCTYSTALPDGTNRTNTATVTTSGVVGGGEATADVIFGDPTTVVNNTINVTDTYAGSLGAFSDSGSVSYTRTFTCGADAGTHGNMATITGTGQSDSASVTVNCYTLVVMKRADTSLTRTWTWTIDKLADQTDLLLSAGQLFQVNYQVTVDATSADSDWAVNGTIWVNNPAPIPATINAVSDVVSPAIAASVDCGVSFPYSLAAGGTLTCTYNADLPNADPRTNTATATLQNYDYDYLLNAAANGTTDFSGSALVDFSGAFVSHVDECIDVSDTNLVFLGTVCAAAAPHTFTYSLWFGLHPDADVILECGYNEWPNTASFVTNDTGATGSDSWLVTADVACDYGCTLTPGYWKTHSEFGPAPYDDTWALLPSGASTPFFLSGQSYYEVLWTSPGGGNAYYILAHAYIAAGMNFLNGASSTPEVDAAFAEATGLFNTFTPAQVADAKGKKGNTLRAQFIALAYTLDQYNNGYIGPGHCSE
jgi:hypothetical protein